MLFKIATFLVILRTILASSHDTECEERIKRECKETVDYPCCFDKQRGCFKHYLTNCDMELAACKNKKVYEYWPDLFCESVQFMCSEEIEIYNWPPDNFFDQIVHLRDNKINPYEEMF